MESEVRGTTRYVVWITQRREGRGGKENELREREGGRKRGRERGREKMSGWGE